MPHTAFSAPGRFYRGNLHGHTTASDGLLDAKEVCERYRAEGYDFVALTDHFVELFGYPITNARHLDRDDFCTLMGAELHSGSLENGELWHILAVGLPADFTPSKSPHMRPVPGQETGPEIAARARDAGAFVAIAHPEWSAMSLADAQSVQAAMPLKYIIIPARLIRVAAAAAMCWTGCSAPGGASHSAPPTIRISNRWTLSAAG